MMKTVGTPTTETKPDATDDTEPGPSALKRFYLATLGSGDAIREESGKLFERMYGRARNTP